MFGRTIWRLVVGAAVGGKTSKKDPIKPPDRSLWLYLHERIHHYLNNKDRLISDPNKENPISKNKKQISNELAGRKIGKVLDYRKSNGKTPKSTNTRVRIKLKNTTELSVKYNLHHNEIEKDEKSTRSISRRWTCPKKKRIERSLSRNHRQLRDEKKNG